MAETAKKLNLRQPDDQTLNISPDEVPTLAPADKLAMWQEGDDDPYYKIQAIEYPTKANGYNYLESFWDSFIGKLNTQLVPGSKDGHDTTWGKRPPTDLLLIGGRIDKPETGPGLFTLKTTFLPSESPEITRFLSKSARLAWSIFPLYLIPVTL